VVKAAISAALIAFALRNVDLAAVGTQLAEANFYSVAAALGLITAISVIHAERWRVVLRRLQCDLPLGLSVKFVLIGYFFNQTLPSTVGGDAYRVWGAYRVGIDVHKATSSVIIDRATALVSLMLMIVLGLPWLLELITSPTGRWIVVILIASGFLALTLVLGLGRVPRVFDRWRVGRMLLALVMHARAVFLDARALALATALTMAGYIIASYAVHLLARAISVDLGFGHSLLLVPLVTLITVLPISIGGWGVRENAMVVALGLIGIPVSAALSLSILYGLVVMASGVPGGVIWLIMRRGPIDARISDKEL
jgi:glycosyltransferase 2 family protein